jgi:transcriptional regulator with XRE-family HTH domain
MRDQDLVLEILKHMRAEELAVRMKVSAQTIYNWKTGKGVHPARVAELKRILTRLERREAEQ